MICRRVSVKSTEPRKFGKKQIIYNESTTVFVQQAEIADAKTIVDQ